MALAFNSISSPFRRESFAFPGFSPPSVFSFFSAMVHLLPFIVHLFEFPVFAYTHFPQTYTRTHSLLPSNSSKLRLLYEYPIFILFLPIWSFKFEHFVIVDVCQGRNSGSSDRRTYSEQFDIDMRAGDGRFGRSDAKAKEQGVDLVEIRLDYVKNFTPNGDLEASIKQSVLPTLITYRPKWEGGEHVGDDSKRLNALSRALELGS